MSATDTTSIQSRLPASSVMSRFTPRGRWPDDDAGTTAGETFRDDAFWMPFLEEQRDEPQYVDIPLLLATENFRSFARTPSDMLQWLLDLASAFYEEALTRPIEVEVFRPREASRQIGPVGISRSLVMPRSKIRENALVPPSAAYLAWMEAKADMNEYE